MRPVVIDLSHRFFNPMGGRKFTVTFIDRTTVERITEGFVEGRTCIIRHCGRAFLAVEITEAFGGRYNLTVVETKLELVPTVHQS
jgi:hypothetical protein